MRLILDTVTFIWAVSAPLSNSARCVIIAPLGCPVVPEVYRMAARSPGSAGGGSTPSAVDAMALLSRTEGIIPAIESAHAVAGALEVAKRLGQEKGPDATIIVNLSGRGDKDMGTAIEWFGLGDAEVGPDADLEQVEQEAAK